MTGPAKAYLQPERGNRIDCLFNPAELKVSKANEWKESKGKGKNTPRLRFQQGKSGTLSMTLVLDTTGTGSPVTAHTNALLKLMEVDTNLAGSDSQRNQGRPPWVRFHWGDFHSFKAIVEKVDLTFTYFAATGVPLRAKAAMTLKQYEDEAAWGPQNPTSGTPAPHRIRQVQPGETLDRIAASEYGDPSRWRLLASANEVTDPFRLAAGALLVVPELTGVGRG
jgi:nucleoid-associated protein YgaU